MSKALGWGKALSRTLAEAMDGTLGVTSAVDVGSSFWIDLASVTAVDTPAALPVEANGVTSQD